MSTTNDATILGKRSRAAFDVNGESVSDQPAAKQSRPNLTSLETLEYTSGVQAVQRGVLLKALDNQLLTDVTFKIGDDSNSNQQHFDVNRLLLAFFSPVFKSMLFDMMESTAGGDVFVNDVEPEIFECIVSFAYSQNPTINTSNVLRVMKACDKYSITSLYNVCRDFLQSNLNQKHFWAFFYEALELNIMHLELNIYDALNTHYAAWLNAENIVEFFSIVHHKQLNNFLEIGYKFMQHEGNVDHAALLVSDSVAAIFCSFCIEAIKIGAFNEQFQESAEKYFLNKYKHCLDASNFCIFYLNMCEHNMPVFQEQCKLFLSESGESMTRSILHSNEFSGRNLQNMRRLLLLPWQCKEEMLWECTVKWADNQSVSEIQNDAKNNGSDYKQQENECEDNGTIEEKQQNDLKAAQLEHRRHLLRSVRESIRFALMDAEFFVKNVQSENVLTIEESLTISTYFHCSDNGCGAFTTQPRCIPRKNPSPSIFSVVYCDEQSGVFDTQIAQSCSSVFWRRLLGRLQTSNDIRFWTQIKNMKELYTRRLQTFRVSEEDDGRWVEIPRDWMDETLTSLQSGAFIGIEEQRKLGTWPRYKCIAWRSLLQVGDIIDTKFGEWSESVVLRVFENESQNAGKCYVHCITRKATHTIRINGGNVAKRGHQSKDQRIKKGVANSPEKSGAKRHVDLCALHERSRLQHSNKKTAK